MVSVGIKPECQCNPRGIEDIAVEGYFDGKVPLSHAVQQFPPTFPIPLQNEFIFLFVKSVSQTSVARASMTH